MGGGACLCLPLPAGWTGVSCGPVPEGIGLSQQGGPVRPWGALSDGSSLVLFIPQLLRLPLMPHFGAPVG